MKNISWNYDVEDISMDCFQVLNKKRDTAMKYKDKFIEEGLENWYNLLIMQTDYINEGYEKFYENLARYIYVARK